MRAGISIALATALVLSTSVSTVVAPPVAYADNTTISSDSLRTGWDPNEPGLSPSTVSSANFGQLFSTQLDGQIYGQPVVAQGVVLVATENDKVYGLNAVTGAIIWTRNVGPAWPASAIGCGDLTPNIGVTSTPVYDPATGTAYFTSKVTDRAGVRYPHWYFHAVNITTGVEQAGFPSLISGYPDGDSSHPFNAKTAMQRPGLLLLGGVVYAAFASHCDHGPYVGYVIGVSASTGVQTTMWSTEQGSSTSGAGIWQSGGGLVSDGPGRIILATGNGIAPAPGPGNAPPLTLGESVVRLAVGSDGKLTAKDFFSPVNNSRLNQNDADLGSGGPMGLPDGFGTAAHPHLLVQQSKDGRIFLLDRDNLGGTAQGAGATDAALQILGPYNGVWGHPAFWGGDGGYVYSIENGSKLRAVKVGVSGNGLPSLTSTATSADTWGFSSGSPVVTSSGSTSGSALVWAIHSDGGTGANGQLRAYNPLPTSGLLTMVYSAPIGTASKFSVPATDGGRVYVGTRDGLLYGFGSPSTVALAGSPTDFATVPVHTTASKSVTLTANRPVIVTGVTAIAPFGVGALTFPVTLAPGDSFTVPVSFTPDSSASASGSLALSTSAGLLAFDLYGTGTQPGLSSSPAALDYGQVPIGASVLLNVNVTNTGTTSATVTSVTAPGAPFSAISLPAVGSSIAAGASISVSITFAPQCVCAATDALVITADTGSVSIPVSGSGVSGAPLLTVRPTDIDFGSVLVGGSVSRSFAVANGGNLTLTLNKAAPPAAPFRVASPISEGQQLLPGQSMNQTVAFAPTSAGAFSGSYFITANDNRGSHRVTVHGIGVAPIVPKVGPAPIPF